MSTPQKVAMVTVKGELDPLLKDLNEKRHNFQRNMESLAAELREVHRRLAFQEQCFAKESLIRQEAETRAQVMEEEISRLQKNLEEKDVQLQASTSAAQMYVKELDDLRLQLAATKSTANASVRSAQSAQLQCATLVKELEEKYLSLKEQQICVSNLGEQLDLLLEELHAREFSQRQLKDEVSQIELGMMEALATAGSNKGIGLRKTLDEVTPRNFDKINKLLRLKDEEIAKLRDEIRTISAHWKLKVKELESQLEKYRRADVKLRKKVSKLKLHIQETRAQKNKLQRMGDQKDKALEELEDKLAAKRLNEPQSSDEQNFWGFRFVVSISMLVMVMFSKC